MEIFRGQRGRAHLSSWEQECCGSALQVGETAAITLGSAVRWDEGRSASPVDWILDLHVEEEGMPPAHRALVRVERVQEVRYQWQQVSADGVAWDMVPGSARLSHASTVPGHDELVGQGTDVEDWVVDVVILEDLGPQPL